MRFLDADGHIMENLEQIGRYLHAPYQDGRLPSLPSLDRFHVPTNTRGPRREGTFDRTVDAQRWLEFLDRTELECSVLYPTTGLAFGQVVYPDWAIAYAHAYNTWLHEHYVTVSPRLKGVALIPMQDVPKAVQELRRAVTELGMVAAMIPSNGLARHVSHREYWPIYEEAERLDVALAVHGGAYAQLGFDSFTVFPATRALGMPFPLAIAATGLIVDGVLDAYPNLRIGFLEGGTDWIPMVIDRLEREREYSDLSLAAAPEAYFRSGRMFVGCEGNERGLSYAVQRVGPEPFMFCSDFPHEISMDNCMEEIDEILERTDLEQAAKTAILSDNARAFYKI
ncbi:MAG: amidohydrolase family protein [Chloroflexi bacterium]|nr:amidohydrolase family protein [Chloroflexota bacterium]